MIEKLTSEPVRTTAADTGLLVLRIAVGAVFIVHGYGDLSQEGGVAVNVGNYRDAGIPVPEFSAYFGAYVQFLGGMAVVAGVLTRLAALGLAVVMAGALVFVHVGEQIPIGQDGSGSGFALIMGAASLALVLVGPGRASVDHLLRRTVLERPGSPLAPSREPVGV